MNMFGSGSPLTKDNPLLQFINLGTIMNTIVTFTGIINALNFDFNTISNGFKYLVNNVGKTTIPETLKAFGFDLTAGFRLYDDIVKVFEPNSNYPIHQFAKEYVFKPPELIDDLYNPVNTILIQNTVSYNSVEDLIFGTINFFSNAIQSFCSTVMDFIGTILSPFSKIFDLVSRNLASRIGDILVFIDDIKGKDQSNDEPDEFDAIKDILIKFLHNGLSLQDLDIEAEIFKLINAFIGPESSLIKAIADFMPDTEISRVINFAYNMIDVFKDENGKISDIQKHINELPEGFFDFPIKALAQRIYDIFIKELPKYVSEKPLIDLNELNIKFITSENIRFLLDAVIDYSTEIYSNLDKTLCTTFSIPEETLKDVSKLLTKFGNDEDDLFDFVGEILFYAKFANKENCTLFAKTLRLGTKNILSTISRVSGKSAFPYTIVLNPVSSIANSFLTYFSQQKISIRAILEHIYPKSAVILDVAYEVFSKINGDLKLSDFLNLFPPKFINAYDTIANIQKLTKDGYFANNMTLPQLANAIVISSNSKSLKGREIKTSFEDLIPIKYLVASSKVIKDTPIEDLTTKKLSEALEIDQTKLINAATSLETSLSSDKLNTAAIIKTFTDFDVTNSFNSITGLVDKLLNNETISTNEVEAVIIAVVEDAKQKSIQPKTPKKGLSAGAIAGIVIACIVVVVGVIIGIVVYRWRYHKNSEDSLEYKP